MGNCIFCGEKAGFLKSKHKECVEKYNDGKRNIIRAIVESITTTSNFEQLEILINQIAKSNFIKLDDITNLYTCGFDNTIEQFLEDGILSIEEEEKISKFKEYFSRFDQMVFDKNGSLQRVVKASVLRDILNGVIPKNKMKINGNIPFIFQKEETLIWLFQEIDYYESSTRTEFHGRSQGISVKIAKGVYYRTGTFKGHPVKIEEMKHLSNGLVALTNKHIYFSSSSKNFKIPYSKIVTIDPYENGIGLQKDGVSSKPIILKGIDGWFAFNLISNLNQI